MADEKNLYEVLGVSKDATEEQIRKAFRTLAVKHHPDAGGDEEEFKKISQAYEILSDPKKKAEYDQALKYGSFMGGAGGYPGGGMGGSAMDWSSVIESILRGEGAFGTGWDPQQTGFGGFNGWGAPRAMKGSDLTMSVEVSFQEAFDGAERKVTYRIPSTGETQQITVKIPAGAVDGGKLRYRERGEYGSNGGTRGDLVVTTRVGAHPFYTRDGADVTMELPVSIYEAALGCEVTVPAPGGKSLKLKVPAGTQHGKVFRFKGMGAEDVKHKGTRGAFYVKIRVEVPTALTDTEKDALTKLMQSDTRDLRAHITKAR